MVEKLKSILRRTNWSLVLKAFFFGATWLVLPFWLFLLVAFYLYFVPFAGSAKVALPFLVLLLVSLLEGKSILFAIILVSIFYYMLLIRDLLIIDRRSAYEILVLVITYLLLRGFFIKEGGSFGGHALFYAIFIAWAMSAMLGSFVDNFSVMGGDLSSVDLEVGAKEAHAFHRALNWISFMLFWQIVIAGLFLPLDFVFQSAIVFLIAAAFVDLVAQYAFGELSRTKLLAASAATFSLLVIILASARWIL